MKIFPTHKGGSKPNEQSKKVHRHEQASKDSKGNGSNTEKDKKTYLGKGKLSTEDIECYKKGNRCHKCGDQGHISRACPKRKVPLQAKKIHHPFKEAEEASRLCFAWGKVRSTTGCGCGGGLSMGRSRSQEVENEMRRRWDGDEK